MTSIQSALAVIIGRAGSKGLPGKNALLIAGKPMIGHTIEDARQASLVDRSIVSTDGPDIAEAAEREGVEVVERPAELADDHATVDAAVRHAIEAIGDEHAVIVILYTNVPVRPDDLIDRAVRTLVESGGDSVQSYSDVGKHHPHWMVKLDAEGRVVPNVERTAYRRQDLPRMLIPDGGVIAVRRESLFTIDPENPHAFLGLDRRGIETAQGSAGAVIDIDDATDFARAESILLGAASTPAVVTP